MRAGQEPQYPPPKLMVFVDAGYLVAGAQKHLKLPSPPRIDGGELEFWASYTARSAGPNGWELIRTYVYDAQFPGDAPGYPEQRAYFDQLAAQPGIRLRLGHLTPRAAGTRKARWEQKGVDTLLVLDLVRMAQLRAFDAAMVVAGDRDLAEALRVVADDHARRVYLFSVEGSAPSDRLVHAADGHRIIDDHSLRRIVGQDRPAGNQPAAPEERKAPRP